MKYLLAAVNFLVLGTIWLIVFAIPSILLYPILYLLTVKESNQTFNTTLGAVIRKLDRIFNLITTGCCDSCIWGVLSQRTVKGDEVALVMTYFVDRVIMRQPGYCSQTINDSEHVYRLPF